MTKTQQEEQAKAIEQLREILKPGETVTTLLRHVSRSGMSRSISVIRDDQDITWMVARAMGEKIDQTHDGIKQGGCGMDMGFNLVYNLARTLYPTYSCLGKGDGSWGSRCPSNAHVNSGPERDNYGAGVVHTDGYVLHQTWL
jgi:hypothetical protein